MLLIGVTQVKAQTKEQPVGFKLMFGAAQYRGDLGNNMFHRPHTSQLYLGVGLAGYLNRVLDLALEVEALPLYYSNGASVNNPQKRSTSFSTNDINFSLLLRIKPFYTRLNPYLAIGVGGNILHYNDHPRNDNNAFIVTIPFGIGINYELSPRYSLNVQTIYNWSFSDDKIDNYPLSASQASNEQARPDIDGNDHDGFLTTSMGIVFNFGGGHNQGMSMEEKLLKQSMKNLKAAQNASDQASDNLRQAHQFNNKTLAALDSLQKYLNQTPQQANQLKEQFVHIVNNIQFQFDKSNLIKTAKTELNSLANIMNHYPGLNVSVVGHADKRGSKAYNQKLGRRRAQSVKQFLVDHGVSASRIATKSDGKTNPLMTDKSDIQTTYAQNRSVQLTLTYHNPNNGNMGGNY
jgi:outer membrane protein OmpA-like peptidoglycan-associated protein